MEELGVVSHMISKYLPNYITLYKIVNYTSRNFWASTKLNGNVGDNPTLTKQIAFGTINKVSTMSAVCQLIKNLFFSSVYQFYERFEYVYMFDSWLKLTYFTCTYFTDKKSFYQFVNSSTVDLFYG